MRLNPFKRRVDERAYTDAIVEARIAAAAQAAAEGATAAEEVVAGLYERAFLQAEVTGIAVPRRVLGMTGRMLATCGECVFDAATQAVAQSIDIDGATVSPLAWRYTLHLASPSGTALRRRVGMDVWHFRINASKDEPWRGHSAFDLAPLTLQLLKRFETSLSSEANGAVGKVITVPAGTPEGTVNAIKQDLRTLQGKTTLPESTAGGWGQGQAAAPQRDWHPMRLGPEPPDSMATIRRDAAHMVLAASGVPVELASGSEGTGAREAWRRFLHATVQPIGESVAEELRLKTGRRVRIGFDALMASDLSGRARAFQSLVNGGMDVAKAAALAGLMEGE